MRQVIDRRFDEIYQLAADMGGAGYIFTRRIDAFEVLDLDQARRLAESGIAEARIHLAAHVLDNVVFTGFLNRSELPALYAAAAISMFGRPIAESPWKPH